MSAKMTNYLLKSSISYTAFSLLQPLLSFIILPFITNTYTIVAYGNYILLLAIMMFFSFVSAFCIGQSMPNYHFRHMHDEDASKEFLSNMIHFSALSNVVIFILLSILFYNIEIIRFGLPVSHVIVAMAAGLADVFLMLFAQYYKNLRAVRMVGIAVISASALTLAGQITIIYYHFNIAWLLLVKFFCTVIICMALYNHEKLFSYNFSKKILSEPIAYALKLLPWIVLTWVLYYGDRLIIERILNAESLAFYGLALTISGLIQIGYTGFGGAIQPLYQRNYHTVNDTSNERLPFLTVDVAT
ncbi:MAG: oligosaccharide flippase family protein, partial [Flavobacteriales bacterium]|nr:oligosaccharide flippase family protein [Flavobacteriales bacterium]